MLREQVHAMLRAQTARWMSESAVEGDLLLRASLETWVRAASDNAQRAVNGYSGRTLELILSASSAHDRFDLLRVIGEAGWSESLIREIAFYYEAFDPQCPARMLPQVLGRLRYSDPLFDRDDLSGLPGETAHYAAAVIRLLAYRCGTLARDPDSKEAHMMFETGYVRLPKNEALYLLRERPELAGEMCAYLDQREASGSDFDAGHFLRTLDVSSSALSEGVL